MNYREFVKENFHKLPASTPAKDKMKQIGAMWQKTKGKGGGVISSTLAEFGLGMKKKSTKKAKGGDLRSMLSSFDGLGMKKKSTKKGKGGGLISSGLAMLGLGMPEEGGRVVGGGMLPPDLMNALHALQAAGKGGSVGGSVGGGLISSGLAMLGLGMPDKVKMKHLDKMHKLEMKTHKNEKLTPTQDKKLRVYHHLHGAGFFDSLFSGVKKVGNFVVDNMDTIKKVVPEVMKFIQK